MMSHRNAQLSSLFALVLASSALSTPCRAQATSATADSVVLRVTSPRAEQVTFSGTVTLRDAKTERRLNGVTTPFELRLPAQDIDARFIADDGMALGGELVSYKAGKDSGRVRGKTYVGTVRLYYALPG